MDYIKGNDTRDLWFCEGVTSTFAELVLLRAGLIDRDTFYSRLASAIQALADRSARHFQSAEMAGREAWLEKYADYNRSDRSISYYNKGELLGYLLDLGIRHASQNQAGLDEVMRRLNQDFARQGRFYTMADLTALIAQLAPAFDVNRFFQEYVRGTQELDYSTYLGYAGLRLATVPAQEGSYRVTENRGRCAGPSGSVARARRMAQGGNRSRETMIRAIFVTLLLRFISWCWARRWWFSPG